MKQELPAQAHSQAGQTVPNEVFYSKSGGELLNIAHFSLISLHFVTFLPLKWGRNIKNSVKLSI